MCACVLIWPQACSGSRARFGWRNLRAPLLHGAGHKPSRRTRPAKRSHIGCRPVGAHVALRQLRVACRRQPFQRLNKNTRCANWCIPAPHTRTKAAGPRRLTWPFELARFACSPGQGNCFPTTRTGQSASLAGRQARGRIIARAPDMLLGRAWACQNQNIA